MKTALYGRGIVLGTLTKWTDNQQTSICIGNCWFKSSSETHSGGVRKHTLYDTQTKRHTDIDRQQTRELELTQDMSNDNAHLKQGWKKLGPKPSWNFYVACTRILRCMVLILKNT